MLDILTDLAAYADAARAAAAAAVRAADRIGAITAAVADSAALDAIALDAIVAAADAVDVELATALSSAALSNPPIPLQTPPPPASPAPPRIPPPTASPVEVLRWWEGMADSEREALLRDCPERIGNLDGVPIQARDRANRTRLNHDMENRDAAAGDGRVLANAVEVSDGLMVNSARTGSPTYLVTYQPTLFDGKGRAAIAIGNPDTADHTAVLVPGTGASVTSGWLAEDTDQSDLFNEFASAVADSACVAVVAWMGYDAPDSLIDPRVARPRLARDGAALLAADVGALRATARPDAHLTVIGHSYGATTVADAAASGMRADDIVLTGSPGSDLAHTAADFHLPEGGHVYVGAASTDPVTFLAGTRGEFPATEVPTAVLGLGADPAADGFGSTRFRAEARGWAAAIRADHDSYFTPGSESLYSIADIAGGDGDLLARHGMTAPHRSSVLGSIASVFELPNWSNPVADPELVRPATGGHFHR